MRADQADSSWLDPIIPGPRIHIGSLGRPFRASRQYTQIQQATGCGITSYEVYAIPSALSQFTELVSQISRNVETALPGASSQMFPPWILESYRIPKGRGRCLSEHPRVDRKSCSEFSQTLISSPPLIAVSRCTFPDVVCQMVLRTLLHTDAFPQKPFPRCLILSASSQMFPRRFAHQMLCPK